MKRTEITCDNCTSDLTATDMPKFRLTLSSEAVPQAGRGQYAVLVHPPIKDTLHFCGLKCLGEWFNGIANPAFNQSGQRVGAQVNIA